jgi:predicted dehydrogenase
MHIDACIIGGGMITNDLLLPSVYHLQRSGVINEVKICALNNAPLKALKENRDINEAFPGQTFEPFPALNETADKDFPDLYKQVLNTMAPRQVAIIAVPDQYHYSFVKQALEANQHVLCVKPLVLNYEHAVELEQLAYNRGLFVGIEYHKRIDRRSLMARKCYKMGEYGEFIMGEAKMIEPYFYRHSNFQNWFTPDNTDPFAYVGCHYVDLVYFITGLKPTKVSVSGVKRKFPNDKEGYLWANGRVIFENGAILSVIDGLGYPDDGAGSNNQGLIMFFEGNGKSGMLKHDDQFRGVIHCYVDKKNRVGSLYKFINTDFIQLVSWNKPGLQPVGYGYESVSNIIHAILEIESSIFDLSESAALKKSKEIIKQYDETGIIATPANSYINELVIEAGRKSILADGATVDIVYDPKPGTKLKMHKNL